MRKFLLAKHSTYKVYPCVKYIHVSIADGNGNGIKMKGGNWKWTLKAGRKSEMMTLSPPPYNDWQLILTLIVFFLALEKDTHCDSTCHIQNSKCACIFLEPMRSFIVGSLLLFVE